MLGVKIVFPVTVLIVALIISIYYSSFLTFIKYYASDDLHASPKKRLFTTLELSQYNGLSQPDLFLAVLGVVYNVTKGADHYGPGQTYNIFVGRDASRCFVTGKFDEEHASDDVTGLSKEGIHSLNHWILFYNKRYTRVGKLIGRYYDKNGKPTQYKNEIYKLIGAAEAEKHNKLLEIVKFPPCNIEWNAQMDRTRFWCTKRSGGIERNWIGVPRQLYEPGSDTHRCACVDDENRNLGNIKEYDGCDPNFDSCYVKV